MTPVELIADSLTGNFHMLKFTLADFSDQEMLVRPVPTANHALWQLGHLAVSERRFLVTVAGEEAAPPPPAEWGTKFTAETTKNDEAAFFPKRDEVLAYYEQVRNKAAAWVRSLSEADLQKPTSGRMASFAPTFGHLALMFANHASMHLGQFQVIRRKLGKPVLF